ncbi:hypothetical protein [Anatilimnocola floriformis]|uniref:hypothetical protein n=1 Tax=Anatilimnocola floriformis TaxID=2948575 RepID=UPI0020C4CF3E|nr:hypothetical protein [Anatilimnocola floriformis]
MRFLRTILLLSVFAAGAGCSSNVRQAVTGNVTLAGEPVNGGSILFLPLAEGGSKGAEDIVEGKYAVPSQRGLLPGKYRVEIRWSKPTGKQVPSGDPGMMMDERTEVVPAKFNSASTLTAEITSDGKKQDFLLTK